MEGEKRQKYRITVDNHMTIVAEEPCHETGVPFAVTEKLLSQNRQTEAALASSPQIQEMQRRGIQFHLEGGKIMIDKVPEIEIKIAQFFVPEAACPWPGCESLRAQYLKELSSLAGADGECSDCERGTLQKKYRQVILKNLEQHAIHDTKAQVSTRHQGVS